MANAAVMGQTDGPTPWTQTRPAVWTAWAVWAGMSLSAVWFVMSHALLVPFADEWHWVSLAGGEQPITAEWLWSQHNEHRLVLPRLAYLGLARLTNYDFHAGGMLNVAMLSILAALAMLSARAMRGGGSVCDAYYPLALLHWAQFTNLLWGFQICLVMATVFIVAGMLAMMHARRGRWAVWAAAAAGCMIAASVSAGAGLAFLPGLALWLMAGVLLNHPPGIARTRGQLLLAVLLTLLLGLVLAAYLAGFQRPPQHHVPAGLVAALRTAGEFLSGTLGAIGKKLWPVSAGCVAIACLLLSAHLLRRMWLCPADRVTALGLLGVLAGCAGLTATIGWSRTCIGPGAGFEDRYVTLAMPLACLFYLQSVALPGRWSTRTQIGLLLLAGLALAPNTVKGWRGAASLQAATGRLVADARAGIPLDGLAVRYLEGTGFGAPAELQRQLDVLWRNGWGPYRGAPRLALRNDVTIRPLAAAAPTAPPVRTVMLGPDRPLAVSIHGTGDLRLERIDVLVARRPRRAPDRIRWELATPEGRVLASGTVDTTELDHTDWLTLRPAAPPLRDAWSLQLRLSVDGPPGARPLEVPLFAPGELPKGFLYGRRS